MYCGAITNNRAYGFVTRNRGPEFVSKHQIDSQNCLFQIATPDNETSAKVQGFIQKEKEKEVMINQEYDKERTALKKELNEKIDHKTKSSWKKIAILTLIGCFSLIASVGNWTNKIFYITVFVFLQMIFYIFKVWYNKEKEIDQIIELYKTACEDLEKKRETQKKKPGGRYCLYRGSIYHKGILFLNPSSWDFSRIGDDPCPFYIGESGSIVDLNQKKGNPYYCIEMSIFESQDCSIYVNEETFQKLKEEKDRECWLPIRMEIYLTSKITNSEDFFSANESLEKDG